MRRDLVIALAWGSWGGPRRREGFHAADRLVKAAATHPRVGRLLIVNATRSAPAVVYRWLQGRRDDKLAEYDHATITTPFRLSRLPPTDPDDLERSMRRYVRHVRRRVDRARLCTPAVITDDPLVAGFAEMPWPVTYYAIDDWSVHPRFRAFSSAIRIGHARIADRGLPVVAVTETLRARLDPTGPSAVVPNGVAPDEWLDVGAPPEWLRSVPRPRAVYVGRLDDRLDVDLVSLTATARPQVSFVVIGGGGDGAGYDRLRGLVNVHVHDHISRRDVTAVLRASDVGLLPHRQTSLTQAMSPLKVYEYLAAGLPVASVDLDPVRAIDDRIVIAEPGGFVAALDSALALGPLEESARRTFVDENSWARRHDRIFELALAAPESVAGQR